MRKEKKQKTLEKGKKNMYLIAAVVIGFLLVILVVNANKAFKNMETRQCVQQMVLFGEGLLQMDEEFRAEMPEDATAEYAARCMIYYFHYGKKAFINPDDGPLKLKDPVELKETPLVERADRYLEDIPTCPTGGEYTLLASETHPGLYDIECSVHGRVYLPEFEDKYLFDGDIDALGPRKTNMGKEADIYFSPAQSKNEFIILIPYTDLEARREAAEESEERGDTDEIAPEGSPSE